MSTQSDSPARPARGAPGDARSRPNVLLLMTDQQRFDTIAAAGHPHMITPNLDRLVREGCLFRNAYSPNPICVPARHHLLTGTTARYHGVVDNAAAPPPPGVHTLPGLLSDAGYDTIAIGKMHFKPVRRHHGFNRMELMEEHPRFREWDEYALYLQSVGFGHLQNLHGIRNLLYEAPQRALVPDEHHGSTWVADRTIRYLERTGHRTPFFCWSSWIAPHPPFDVPASVADLYRDRPLPAPLASVTELNEFSRQMTTANTLPPRGREAAFLRRRQEAYYAQITYVDRQIGRILDTLERLDLLDQTLILFTSDHGEMLGDHGCIQKSQPYDSASRIPLVARHPARFAAGSECNDFADLNDILPTVLDLAGLEHPEPDCLAGGSLLRDDRDRSQQYLSLGHGARRFATLRDRRYKYTYYYSLEQQELFDLEHDPGETTNLLISRPEGPDVAAARDRLHARLVELEGRWGPVGECLDPEGRLRRYPSIRHLSRQEYYAHKAREFPGFPAQIADPQEAAVLTPFAEEALAAIRDEPVTRLHEFDLGAWKDQGATEAFLARIRREGR